MNDVALRSAGISRLPSTSFAPGTAEPQESLLRTYVPPATRLSHAPRSTVYPLLATPATLLLFQYLVSPKEALQTDPFLKIQLLGWAFFFANGGELDRRRPSNGPFLTAARAALPLVTVVGRANEAPTAYTAATAESHPVSFHLQLRTGQGLCCDSWSRSRLKC